MKKKFFQKFHNLFAVIFALMLTIPMPVFASEIGTDDVSTGNPSSQDTDIKIIDSMPMLWADSELNAFLAVVDASGSDVQDLNGQTVSVGTVLTYIIGYRNDNETTETVHLQVPVPDDFPLRSSYQGTYVGTLVSWDDITVEPGETVTRYITCDTPHTTDMIPNTGLVSIEGKTLQTNTVQVAVAGSATTVVTPDTTTDDSGVLGAFRRALKAAEDSPAVLGVRRAIQTGDIGYLVPRFVLLVAIALAISSIIVLIIRRGRSDEA